MTFSKRLLGIALSGLLIACSTTGRPYPSDRRLATSQPPEGGDVGDRPNLDVLDLFNRVHDFAELCGSGDVQVVQLQIAKSTGTSEKSLVAAESQVHHDLSQVQHDGEKINFGLPRHKVFGDGDFALGQDREPHQKDCPSLAPGLAASFDRVLGVSGSVAGGDAIVYLLERQVGQRVYRIVVRLLTSG